jgi:hypothetical protein
MYFVPCLPSSVPVTVPPVAGLVHFLSDAVRRAPRAAGNDRTARSEGVLCPFPFCLSSRLSFDGSKIPRNPTAPHFPRDDKQSRQGLATSGALRGLDNRRGLRFVVRLPEAKSPMMMRRSIG